MPETTCRGDGEDSGVENIVENSHLTQSDIVEEQSGTVTEQAITQEQTEHDTIKVDGSEAEEVTATSSDRGMLNNTSGGSQKLPMGDCAIVIPQRIESDRDCENLAVEIPVTVFVEVDREQLRTSVLNMADEPGNFCIEMDNVFELERNDADNSCDKSPSDTTKILYFSEGESTDVESDVCRICHCSEEMEILISPCLCTGSVKFVHHSCLMNWLQRAVMSKCELCLYPLAVKRKRKPFSKWRLPEDKPFPILWLFTFVVAMTLNVASIAKDGSQRCVSNPCIIFYVLGSAGALLGLAFFYHWLRKTLRYIAKWIALNQEWSLVGPIDLRSHLGQTNLAYSSKSLSETDATGTQEPSSQIA